MKDCEAERVYDEETEQWRAWCSHHLGIYNAEVAAQGDAEVIYVCFSPACEKPLCNGDCL